MKTRNTLFYLCCCSNILCWMFLLYACAPSSPLETALVKAGKNRAELEKVLNHFSSQPEDSLKYKAACFLIEHMPGHTSLNDSEAEHYIDSLRLNSNAAQWIEWKMTEQMYLRHVNLLHEDAPLSNDIETLNATQLIEYIESVFRQYDTCPWLKESSFETFCEYLLPYHLYREKSLLLRDSIPHDLQQAIARSQLYDACRTSVTSLSRQLHQTYSPPYSRATDKLPPHYRTHQTDCRDHAIAELLLHRLAGIPAALDMTPAWGNYDGNHAWVHPIDARFQSRDEIEPFDRSIAKVYRQTYSMQNRHSPATEEFVPPFFRDPFLKDVTNEYVNATQIIEKNFPTTSHYGYLCVFNEREWKPVAQTTNRKGTCTFDNVGIGNLYLPIYYDGKQAIPTSNPFIIQTDGSKRYLNAQNETEEVTLFRKYPTERRKSNYIRPFHCMVEGSNSPDFQSIDTLGYAENFLPTVPFQVYPNGKYRFIRISPLRQKFCHLAEIYFTDAEQRRTMGKSDKAEISYFPSSRLTDNDILTYLLLSEPITFSFPENNLPSCIQLLPANDGNGIYPDNEYELLYFDFTKGWVSCGKQCADSYQLTFHNTPKGALLWLQNLTTGKEERIFTYENNRQHFR